MNTVLSESNEGPGINLLPASSAPQSITPRPPDGSTKEAQNQVAAQVAAFAETMEASLNNRAFALTLENLGRPEQDLATKHIELIETRVNALVKTKDRQADIPDAVTGMRQAIDKLNPQRAEQSRLGKLLIHVPGGRAVFNLWLASGLRQMAMNREIIRDQIKGIKDGLMGNRGRILGDNTQLDQLYEYVVAGAMSGIQNSAYFCELLLEKAAAIQKPMAPDDSRRPKMQRAIEMVTVRVRNLRQTENALQQGLAAIDITVDGNRKVAESMEETAILTTNYLTMAMAIYQALAHQQDAIETLIRARQGTADVVVKTSEMARRSAETVAELYFNPVAEMEKFEAAQANLISALKTLEDASRNGVHQSEQSIIKFGAMTEELRKKQAELRAGHDLGTAQSQKK